MNESSTSSKMFLPPFDAPSCGDEKRSKGIEFDPRSSIKYTLYAYSFGMFGPWLITSMSGVLLTASLAYWFAPDHAGMVISYFMPDFVQSGWDTASGLVERVRSLGGK